MKKASIVLFKISTILNIVFAVFCAVAVPFLFITGTSAHVHDMIAEAYQNGEIATTFYNVSPEFYANMVQTQLVVLGVVLSIDIVTATIAAIIGVKARKEATRGLLIASIIFGALAVELMIVAGILGLSAYNREKLLNNENQ